jgi:undecaprenyl-diphosphatase
LKSRLGKGDRDATFGWYIIIGTMPILIAGILFQNVIETTLRNMWITVTVLFLFGILLWVVDARFPERKTVQEMNWKEALLFGVGQMLALIPGVSRSGGTITFGRAMGYTREDAVRVSFIMAIPAVFGSGVLEAVKAIGDYKSEANFPGWGATIAATIVSFIVGYIVIIAFLKFVSTFSYKAFAIYRIVLAVLVAVLLIAGVLQASPAAAEALSGTVQSIVL